MLADSLLGRDRWGLRGVTQAPEWVGPGEMVGGRGSLLNPRLPGAQTSSISCKRSSGPGAGVGAGGGVALAGEKPAPWGSDF